MKIVSKNWKNILLIFLVIFSISTCTGKGNYKRKYNNEVAAKEHVIDSLTNVYSNSAKYIDSLRHVIAFKDAEISSLNKQLDIYNANSKRAINITIDSTGVKRR